MINRLGSFALLLLLAFIGGAKAQGRQQGSGITLAAPLSRSHANGVPVVGSLPTPGTANQYSEGAESWN